MDKERKAKWVAALRSGEYEQGSGILHDKDTNKYCCLGVLHVVAGVPLSQIEGKAFGQSCSLLGSDVNDLMFVKMNDSERLSFAQIADYIEANL